MADVVDKPIVTDKPKKKQVTGRKREFSRDEKLRNHVTGPPCNCKVLKCFQITTEDDRSKMISHFNSLKTKDEQDAFLASLISVHSVQRRRSRKEEPTEAEFHNHSYKYHMNIVRDGRCTRIDVCVKGFISIFDVTENRVRRIRESLAATGGLTDFVLI